MALAYDAERIAAFYDDYGEREWERLEDDPSGEAKFINHARLIRRYLPPDALVLDAGCGPGRFAIELVRLGARVVLADLSAEQLALAQEKIAQAGMAERIVGVHQVDICALSLFEDDHFDMTICYGGALSYVLERRDQALAELIRVTRPGDSLLVGVMSLFGTLQTLARTGAAYFFADPDHFALWRVLETGDKPEVEGFEHPALHFFHAAELREWLEAHGCQVLEIAASNILALHGADLAPVHADPAAWKTLLALEERLCTAPGLLDCGSHIIAAVRTPGAT